MNITWLGHSCFVVESAGWRIVPERRSISYSVSEMADSMVMMSSIFSAFLSSSCKRASLICAVSRRDCVS